MEALRGGNQHEGRQETGGIAEQEGGGSAAVGEWGGGYNARRRGRSGREPVMLCWSAKSAP
jgi:hypothetical protein